MRNVHGLARRAWVAVALASAMAAGGCADFNLLTTADEVALGRKLAAQVEEKAELYPDPAVQAYVQEIGGRVARVCQRQDVTYRFKVLHDHNQVNAFAAPGGFIYAYTGLLRLAESEAELASVLAHETGHVAARHSAENISQQIGVNVLLSVLLGEDPGMAAKLGSQLLAGLGFSQMSQRMEYEADSLGLRYMKAAGYDPQAAVDFLRKLHATHERNPGPLARLFATHPLTTDRIARAQQLVSLIGPGGRVGAETYQQRLAKLKAEPAPPKESESGRSASRGSPSAVASSPPPRPAPPPPPPAPPRAAAAAARPGVSPGSRSQERIMICRNLTKGNVVARRVELATTARERRRGLLGRQSLAPHEGMLLVPCRSVHTRGMAFPIDIVFLDKDWRVVKLLHEVKPGAWLKPCLRAHSTLELSAGRARACRLEVGDRLLIERPRDDAARR
ncbi:MAG: M48 family metalloprotease [Candidatus Brocadiia bacterium]